MFFWLILFPTAFLPENGLKKFLCRQAFIKEKLAKDIDFHLQEESRLFYVGMTRAKELLYFTGADYYGTGKRMKKLSPFVLRSFAALQAKKT